MAYIAACTRFPEVSASRFLGSLVLLAIAAAALPAAASEVVSFYTVPTKVELRPDDGSATEVVIHGAFTALNDMTGQTYTYADPRCGVVYSRCAAGQGAMCRMQWLELRGSIADPTLTCRGFGAQYMKGTAKIREEGAPLVTPDVWDLGMGITTGSYIDGKCEPARKLSCPIGQSDGGASGGGGTRGGTGGSAGASQPGSGGSRGEAGSGGGAAPPIAKKDGGVGCAIGGGSARESSRVPTAAVGLALVALALLRWKRR
jgi:uncharacterized membrane protein YgcG